MRKEIQRKRIHGLIIGALVGIPISFAAMMFFIFLLLSIYGDNDQPNNLYWLFIVVVLIAFIGCVVIGMKIAETIAENNHTKMYRIEGMILGAIGAMPITYIIAPMVIAPFRSRFGEGDFWHFLGKNVWPAWIFFIFILTIFVVCMVIGLKIGEAKSERRSS